MTDVLSQLVSNTLKPSALPRLVDPQTGELWEADLPATAEVVNYRMSPEWEAMQDALAGAPIRLPMLDRYTLGNGRNAAQWTPPEDSMLPPVTDVEGVVVLNTRYRFFYDTPYSPQKSTPPACVSFDSVSGMGQPGGDCDMCKYKRRGSMRLINPARDSGASACQERGMAFVLPIGSPLPVVLDLSPSAADTLANQLLRSATAHKGLRLHQAIWNFGLVPYRDTAAVRLALRGLLDSTDEDYINEYAALNHAAVLCFHTWLLDVIKGGAHQGEDGAW